MGVRFIDTDAWIAAETGRSPEAWILNEGIEAFRQKEKAAMEVILTTEPPLIVALGGGSLTIPGLAACLKSVGWILWIDPPWPWLLGRLRQFPRPLLREKPESEWHQLWMTRRAVYRQADLHWVPHQVPETVVLRWTKRLFRINCAAS